MMQTDWRELIDSSFDEGPAPRVGMSDTVTAGRSALRRRRARLTAIAGGGTAMIAILAPLAIGSLSTGAIGDGDQGPAGPTRANQTQAEPGPSRDIDESELRVTLELLSRVVSALAPDLVDPGAGAQGPAIVTDAGHLTYDAETDSLELPAGWELLDRVDQPGGTRSVAIEVSDGQSRLFAIFEGAGADQRAIVARPKGITFEEFVEVAPFRLTRDPGRGR